MEVTMLTTLSAVLIVLFVQQKITAKLKPVPVKVQRQQPYQR